MRRNYQGGSLAGFIIIAVLLGLVLIAGLYGLNRYNAQKSGDETITASKDEAATEKTESTEATTDDTASNEEQAPADPGNQTRTDTSSERPAATAPASQLPQTGPADTLYLLLVVTALTFASVHFVRSRTV